METYRDQYAELFRGGRDIVLIALATDEPETQFDWASEADFPFLFASDPRAEVGRMYGAARQRRDGRFIDTRTLFIVDTEGVIAWVAAPFREIDPTAYEELGSALERIVPQRDE